MSEGSGASLTTRRWGQNDTGRKNKEDEETFPKRVLTLEFSSWLSTVSAILPVGQRQVRGMKRRGAEEDVRRGEGESKTDGEFVQTISLRSLSVKSDEHLPRLILLLHHIQDPCL
jgi:hypothetical protein